MANITRIKAHDSAPTPKKTAPEKSVEQSAKVKPPKKEKKPKTKKPFILFRPFVAFGRYLRDSWRELRQVRWPNRKVTWKMVLAVFVYTALFITLLVLFDMLFDWLFNLIFNQ